MRFLKYFLLILLLSFIVQLWLPWWTMTIVSFTVSYIVGRNSLESFLAGFLAIGVLWFSVSFYIDWATSSLLSQKIAQLFPGKSVFSLRAITVIVGGLTGGFASLSGYLFKTIR